MARVAVTPVTSSTAGAVCTPVNFTADGISVPNDGRTAVIVNNGAGAPATITTQFGDLAQVDGIVPPDRTKSVVNATSQVFGPWGSEYNQTDRQVFIDVSSPTSVTYQVIRVNPK
ncbi:hypothetical protein ACFYUV_04020 [Nonomuraea sp. NPDC003560]|uniref:hypothetical protein n=1 Tax=Nonomuraea sp. NPDC003560 TaxID=3364341 RepID=UPI0036AC5E3F